MPIVLAFGLNFAFPNYLDFLTTTLPGCVIAIAIGVCWVGALVLARKVLNIDI